MNEKIDLNDMRLFVAVVRAGSLSKASELLGVSKSRLSRRLTGLENALGTTLLDRGRRGILLNELGTQFFQNRPLRACSAGWINRAGGCAFPFLPRFCAMCLRRIWAIICAAILR